MNGIPQDGRPDEAVTIAPRPGTRPARADEAETIAPRAAPAVLAGRYRMVRQLGQGGMGSVWLAEDRKLDGRAVAIKMLPVLLAGKPAFCRQVKDEALMAMKLSHPNIATVRGFEEDEAGNPFLVMDYVEGRALDDILAEKGPLGEAEARAILEPVAAALDYAHAQGVVHRDVKPGNVIVRKDGTPFVLDFGIAREVQETMTRVTGETSGGTLLYMSPEQLRGRAPKAAQDVYSFAAMAYECLTGRPPFSRGQIEWQILNEEPEPLPEGVSAELRRGVMAGLAKEPGGRPASCAGVVAGGAGEWRTGRPAERPRQDSGKEGRTEAEGKGTDDVFLLSVRLERRLKALQGVKLAAGARPRLQEVRDAWEAGQQAMAAGQTTAAARLFGRATSALDAMENPGRQAAGDPTRAAVPAPAPSWMALFGGDVLMVILTAVFAIVPSPGPDEKKFDCIVFCAAAFAVTALLALVGRWLFGASKKKPIVLGVLVVLQASVLPAMIFAMAKVVSESWFRGMHDFTWNRMPEVWRGGWFGASAGLPGFIGVWVVQAVYWLAWWWRGRVRSVAERWKVSALSGVAAGLLFLRICLPWE